MEELPRSKSDKTIYMRTFGKIYNGPTKLEPKFYNNNSRTTKGAF